ncbi:DNA endonuclease SmrA [Alteromonas sp. ASW11-36]|uniref:DNA endonuclease SmrA n=1 Tax=Alteromonas arenosi TaxID=3055817 RepID=A0ABT7SVI5_9ALTE|nr:DNA endonuclease SmrA [Alteromonas sp. ASW11-36]MDM7860191.1 DNA endonuclease SmrA [Alteromonas sp. ASW11-36]
MANSDDNFSFADALSEELGEIKPLAQEDSAAAAVMEQKRDKDVLAKQLKRAAIMALDENDTNPLSVSLRLAVKPDDMLSYKRSGIQDGVFKNLRLGKYALEGTIELQRMRIEEARKVLYLQVQKLHQKGVRAILVKHGRGEHSKPIPALCKSYVYQWLQELPEVIAFHSALPRHGSLASTYVLLKKHADQKQINRERLYKRQG